MQSKHKPQLIINVLEVDWSSQIKLLDQDTWSQVEVLVHNGDQLLRGKLGGSVRVNVDRKRLGHTDSVRELHQTSSGKTSVDQRLGNPSGGVGGRSVDLRKVLSRKGTTTVGTPSSVSVDNDLSTGQTSISVRTTNDKSTRRLNVVDGLVV
ncbi:hypothetical protein OGATHE_003587 [Ogataea polymorpha]|uniref:Uncharacterized protein n=1 Tax=Ogataea polymorpha TaxID=460523 RepID=A0A9P8P3Y6_9ASCO|nr:hypothetical protein OGATHE_003587 [Ogataea polymorpha]